jgi:peptidoglycan/LPS O-acetylase OafA/YrhL
LEALNSQNSSNLSLPYFHNLNGLRAIGAIAVFIFHAFLLGHEMWGDFYESSSFQAILIAASKGNYGVSLFFVLSGFLITYLLLHEARTKGQVGVFHFFMRRLLRIWPVYFLVVGFGFWIFPNLPFGITTSHSGWMYVFFLSNIEEIRNGLYDAVNFLTITWSVSIEEQFYLSWVLLMLVFPFLRRAEKFLPYFLVVLFVSILFRWLFVDDYRVLYYHTFAVMSDLAMGGILAYTCFHWNIQRLIEKVPKWLNLLIYALGILMILGVRKVFQGDLIVFEKIATGTFFVYVIADQTFGKNSFFKSDNIPGFFQLGNLSYGFYMYHCIVLYYVQMVFLKNGWTDQPFYFVTYFVLAFASTIAISALSYQVIEKPFLRLKRHFPK